MISCLCRSQDYPRLAVIDNDTLALITIPQLRIINEKLVDLDEEREKIKILSEQISTYQEMNNSLSTQLDIEKSQSVVLKRVIENYEVSMELYEEKSKKDYRRSLFISGAGVTVGIAGILFFILK